MRHLPLFLILLSSSLQAAPPAAAAAAKSGLDTAQLERIPARMKAFVDRGELPGVVTLVARHGTVASLDAQGWQDIEAKKPMRTDSIFQVMSMTKPFAGVAIMMLMEEGKLTLNDPVEKHLPEFRGQWVNESKDDKTRIQRRPARPITIRDLMTHTSGMQPNPPEGLKELYQRMDLPLGQAVAIYSQQALDFDPGTKWQYSNMGIATLGRVVEVAADQPFEQFASERIFKPLGMKDSFFFAPPDRVDRIAIVYRKRADGRLEKAGNEILGGDSTRFRKGAKYSAPEFGLYTTAPDLARFYQMMLNNGSFEGKRLFSAASVDLMTRLHTGDLRPGMGTGFGLTWEVVKEPLGTLALLSDGAFGHGGAFGTHGWIDRKKDLVGVYLIQVANGGDDGKRTFMGMAGAAVTE